MAVPGGGSWKQDIKIEMGGIDTSAIEKALRSISPNLFKERAAMNEELSQLLRTVRIGEETVFDIDKEITGEGDDKVKKHVFQVGSRKLLPEEPRAPKKTESPKRAHVFQDPKDFCAYIASASNGKGVIFIDAVEKSARAVLDETAEQGFEVVEYHPEIDPLLGNWIRQFDKDIPAKLFSKWLAGNLQAVHEPDPKELRLLMAQVRTSRSMEVWSGTGPDAVNGVRVTDKVRPEAADDSTIISFPEEIVLMRPIFVGCDEVEIRIPLTVSFCEQAECPVVTLSAGDIAVKMLDTFAAMVKTMREDSGLTVYAGKLCYEDWKYLRERE